MHCHAWRPHKARTREGRVFQTFEPPYRRAARANLLALIGFVGLCLLVSLANGAVTATSVKGWYLTLARPPGTPPNWLFAPAWLFTPAWTTLYVLMGVSAWLVWRRIDVGAERKRAALRLWGWQLALNALWPAVFFAWRAPAAGLAVILLLLAAAALTVRAFLPLHRLGGALLLPYVAWLSYATYLNAGFWWLNR